MHDSRGDIASSKDGGRLGESCSTVANFDWLAIFGLMEGGLSEDEDDCDGEGTATVIGEESAQER